MKKIIDGKLYNTNTATRLAYWDDYGEGHNIYARSESLYRKHNGEFFLIVHYFNSFEDGRVCDSFDALCEAEAMFWAEEHMDADDYMKIWNVEE